MENQVGLKKGAVNSIWYTAIYGCSLISPGMCIGGIIGYVAGMTGLSLVLAMLLAGLINYLWVVNYANLVQKFPRCGCHYTYIREGLNPSLGFLLGWGVLPVYIFACGAHVIVFGGYFQSLFPQIPFFVIAVLYMVMIAAISIRGIKLTTVIGVVLFSTETLILLALSLTAIGVTWPTWTEIAPQMFWPHSPWTWGTVAIATTVCVYNYIGFASITGLVEESTPSLVSKGMYISVAIVTVVYVIASMGIVLAWPDAGSLAKETEPLVNAGKVFWNKYWPFVTLAVLISTTTCSLACINLGARMMYDMSRDGCLPSWLGKIHPKYQTPWSALVFSAFFYVIAALWIPYIYQIECIVFVMLLAYIGVALANIRVSWDDPSMKNTILNKILPALGIVLSVYLLLQTSKMGLLLGGGWMVFSALFTLYLYIFKRQSLENLDISEM